MGSWFRHPSGPWNRGFGAVRAFKRPASESVQRGPERSFLRRLGGKNRAFFGTGSKVRKKVGLGTNAQRSQILKKYGITIYQYMDMLELQNGLCAICLKPETAADKKYGKIKNLAVDHDHKTGLVRGLLCFKCNYAIGLLEDSPQRARNAAKYLEEGLE